MKNKFCAIFLVLTILIFCASGVTVVITPPRGSMVRVRSRPSLTSPSITTLGYSRFNADCRTRGEVVASPSGASSDVWYHLSAFNGYVAGLYVRNPSGRYIRWCRRPPPIGPPDVPVVGIAPVGDTSSP